MCNRLAGYISTRTLCTIHTFQGFLSSRGNSPHSKSRCSFWSFIKATGDKRYVHILLRFDFSAQQLLCSGIARHGEAPSQPTSTSTQNSDLLDDLTHRTPYYGFTSEVKEQQGTASALSAKTKDIAVDSRFKQDGHNSHSKGLHDRASQDRGSRQETVRLR